MNKELKFGIGMILVIFLIAIFANYITPFDPHFMGEELNQAPSRVHILGTDGYGRDILSMVIYGSRTSLKVGLIAAFISLIIGTIYGAISGYFGGIVDKVMNEINNMFMMLPSFFLILIIVAIYGSSLRNMIIVIALTSWTSTARLMRSQAISLRERTYVKAAKVLGEKNRSILIHHIIPNGIFPVIANATMMISGAILSEAGLSFLGLGDPNVISWGQILAHGKSYLPRSWWISTFSGLAVMITVFSFYLLGEGLYKRIENR